jgi:Xaa-Pro dipeptidase
MEEKGIDCLYIGPGHNMLWVSNFTTKPELIERLSVVILPIDGDPIHILPKGQIQRASHFSWMKDMRGFVDGEDPLRLLKSVLIESGLSSAKIGIEGTLVFMYYEWLKQVAPNAEIVNADNVFDYLRMVKDKEEITLLRKAAEIAELGARAAIENAEIGKTEKELAWKVEAAVRDAGAIPIDFLAFNLFEPAPYVMVSKWFLSSSSEPEKRKITGKNIMHIDVCPVYQNYVADYARTIFIGQPTKEQVDQYEVVLEASKKCIDAIKPGVEFQEIQRIYKSVFEEGGLGKYYNFRIGHGLGLSVHEAPLLAEGNRQKFEPGMVVAIEPLKWDTPRDIMHIEDDVLVTKTGNEVLTKSSRELTVI